MPSEVTCGACGGSGINIDIEQQTDQRGNIVPVSIVRSCQACHGNGKVFV